jgi:hypothetical protein
MWQSLRKYRGGDNEQNENQLEKFFHEPIPFRNDFQAQLKTESPTDR